MSYKIHVYTQKTGFLGSVVSSYCCEGVGREYNDDDDDDTEKSKYLSNLLTNKNCEAVPCNSRVNLLSRYGICPRFTISSPRALMTLPSANKPLFMLIPKQTMASKI